MNIVLWIIQVLLALLFLFSGGMKLVIPPDVLQSMGSPKQVILPGLFIRLDSPRTPAESAEADTAGRSRARDHHDWRNGPDDHWRWYWNRSDPFCSGTSCGIRGLWSFATGTA